MKLIASLAAIVAVSACTHFPQVQSSRSAVDAVQPIVPQQTCQTRSIAYLDESGIMVRTTLRDRGCVFANIVPGDVEGVSAAARATAVSNANALRLDPGYATGSESRTMRVWADTPVQTTAVLRVMEDDRDEGAAASSTPEVEAEIERDDDDSEARTRREESCGSKRCR